MNQPLLARSTRMLPLALCCGISLWWAASLVGQEVADSVERDYADELPRLPALEPAEALASFQVAEGFRVELVAAEPLVEDPVAFAFDAGGRLFVVEMKDYSEQETEHLGRVALLEDTDGDGAMDQRRTFCEGLSWPTAIWPWKDGVLVAEPPRITWYRDTDGDGTSDVSEDWFHGFGRSNVQGLVNSLRWGLDGFIYGATSSAGADIEQPQADSQTAPLPLRRTDFCIDPLRKSLQASSGGGQHGLSFNRWGDKFVTSNSDHLQQIIDLEQWLSSYGTSVRLPALRRSIAADGPQAEVYRISPVEPWRVVRTRLRVGGLVPGPVEGGGRAAGYFTGATGTCIMDREAGFGDGVHDTALVCDVGSNLVHRKRLIDNGLFWTGQRIDPESELLRSSDTWFRPVQLGAGPDGALYIADMVREVIEHPKSLPPVIKRHLDLTSGRNRGRIWRLVPEAVERPPTVDLSTLDLPELVEMLASPIRWRRLMASQLLVERQASDRQATEQLLALVRECPQPETRLLALHVAGRLEVLDAATLQAALADQHARVVEQALQVARRYEQGGQVAALLEQLPWENTRVQLQLALLTPELTEPVQQTALQRLLPTVQHPLVRSLVAAVAVPHARSLLDSEAGQQLSNHELAAWLELWVPTWEKQLSQDSELVDWMIQGLLSPAADRQIAWLNAVSHWESPTGIPRLLENLTDDQAQALTRAIEKHLAGSATAERFAWLRLADSRGRRKWIKDWLEPERSPAQQTAAVDLIATTADTQSAKLLISKLPALTLETRTQALRVLASRPGWAHELLEAIAAGRLNATLLPAEIKQQLQASGDQSLAHQAIEVLGKASSDRNQLVEDTLRQLSQQTQQPSAERGRAHFQKVCAQCHQLSGLGNDVGAPLKQLSDRSDEQLLSAILDPNREVDPRYQSYSVLLEDDRILTGLITRETASQLVLVEAGGRVREIPRAEIVSLNSSGNSLMPEGMEAQLSVADLADLMQFLRHPSQASN